jgi:hypothetical protein
VGSGLLVFFASGIVGIPIADEELVIEAQLHKPFVSGLPGFDEIIGQSFFNVVSANPDSQENLVTLKPEMVIVRVITALCTLSALKQIGQGFGCHTPSSCSAGKAVIH